MVGKGGNSTAYEIKNHPEKILLTLGSEFSGENSQQELEKELAQVQRKIEKYSTLSQDVNAPKILKGWIEKGKLLEVMERAKGHPIHDRKGDFETWQRELEVLANIPDEHYEKFFGDVRTLEEAGFKIDPSKPDNFFYDSVTGFHFIDLGLNENLTAPRDPSTYIVPLINTSNLFGKYGDKISPEVRTAVERIIDKCTKTGIINPESKWWQHNGDEIRNKLTEPYQLVANTTQQDEDSSDVF